MMKLISIIIFCLPVLSLAGKVNTIEKKWTGVYAGGNLGGIFNQASLYAKHISFSNWDDVCHHKNRFSSAFIGGQLGFYQQLNDHFVAGIDGDYDYNFTQATLAQCECEFDTDIYDRFQIKNRQQAAIRGRLGYLFKQNILTFISGGASFTNLSLSYTNEAEDNYLSSKFQPGWLVGGGVEWAYNVQWSVRLEYYYNQYNQLPLSIPTIYGILDTGAYSKINFSSNNIRVGFNYWF